MKENYQARLQKYNLLLEKNEEFRSELALLKDKSGLTMPENKITTKVSTTSVNKYSTPKRNNQALSFTFQRQRRRLCSPFVQ